MIFFGFIHKTYLKFLSFFVEKPNHKLLWSLDDFQKGKKWAETQPHPYLFFKTLWDYCHDPKESLYTIKNLNKFIN